MRPALRALTLVLVSILPAVATTASAQTPLRDWVPSKGFNVRLNPNDNPLVGEIYPGDDVSKGSRISRLENCWPQEFIEKFRGDAWKEHAASTEIAVSFRQTELGAFLRFARQAARGTGSDVAALEADLRRTGVRFVSLTAIDQFERPISSLDIEENVKRDACRKQLFNPRNVIVSNALGASSLSYVFTDDRGSALNVSANALSLLFRLGMSKAQSSAGVVSFDRPVYVGFQSSRWCQARGAFLPAKERCR